MANMMLVYRIMPEDGEVEYEALEKSAVETIKAYDSSVKVENVSQHEVGFGLKAVKVKFQVDENKGSEALEEQLKELPEVGDVVIELMDRL